MPPSAGVDAAVSDTVSSSNVGPIVRHLARRAAREEAEFHRWKVKCHGQVVPPGG